MNKERRKAIADIGKQLAEVQGRMEDIMNDIDALKSEEEEYMENMPENMQGGERYEMAETACDNLDEAYSKLEEVKDGIDEVVEYLDEASN